MADMLVKIVAMKAVLWLNSFFYYFRRLRPKRILYTNHCSELPLYSHIKM